MNKTKAIWTGIAATLLLALGSWAFGLFGGTDPALANLKQLGEQMRDESLPQAQRDQMRGQFRQQMENLSEDQRQAFFDANRGEWMARSQQRMNEFFAMSKADQQKRLDEILNRMAQPRSGSQNARGNPNGGGPGGRNMTEAQREERSKRRIENTDPKMRAQFSEFRRMLGERAQQRGIKLDQGRGGFGGGMRGA